MPIYEYRCEHCGTVTDALQKMSDAPLRDCERCGTEDALTKLLSAHVVGGAGPTRSAAPPMGCGRCGDPQGPCAMAN